MLKRMIFTLIFLVSACVTVNIYFPAAAVERAADQIVKETWGGPAKPAGSIAQSARMCQIGTKTSCPGPTSILYIASI